MRILQVIPAVAARYGGPSQAVFQLSRALTAAGIDVTIATTDADGPHRLTVPYDRIADYGQVPTIFFPVTLSERFTYSPQLAKWLKQHVTSFDAVHIHAIFSHPSLAAARACQKTMVPYVVRPLGSLDPWSLAQKSWRKKALWSLAVERMLSQAAAVHYTSIDEKHAAESALGLTNGVVIPLGMDLPVASPRVATSDEPYVLVLSRLHPKKNLESLIEAFAKVVSNNNLTQWRLVIAGDGDHQYVDKLKSITGSTGVAERINFTCWVDGAEREELLSGAELLALPSRQENFGLCVAEALAHAVPVVISDRVNLASQIGAAGAGWITGLDSESIAAALKHAMNDREARIRRGRAGRELVAKHFCWPQRAADLFELYSSCAATLVAPQQRSEQPAAQAVAS